MCVYITPTCFRIHRSKSLYWIFTYHSLYIKALTSISLKLADESYLNQAKRSSFCGGTELDGGYPEPICDYRGREVSLGKSFLCSTIKVII